MIDKKNELVWTKALATFFLPFSFFSLSAFICVARHFYCIETWLSSSYTRIQFILSSVRHTQLNGNMAVMVERRKELVHTHTFFVRIKDYAFWCLSLSLPFFFSLSLFFWHSVQPTFF